jgi:hypothetical protein
MSPSVDNAARTRWITYVVLGVIFLLLAVVGLFVFRSATGGIEAQRKADELTTALTEAGLPVPSRDQIVRTLGTDGGVVCADPGSALGRAALNTGLSNGAAGPGQRPVIADENVVRGLTTVIGVYCPDELADFQEFTGELKFADVAGEG